MYHVDMKDILKTISDTGLAHASTQTVIYMRVSGETTSGPDAD